MRLFYSPFHTFIHKVLVTAHEAGVWDQITFVPTFPFKNNAGEDQGDKYTIAALNPLDKVPTLALDDGTVLYASQTIVEYLDSLSTGQRLYPPDGPARWDALTRLALSDTIFETTVVLVMEGWYPEAEQRMSVFEWIWPKLIRGLDTLEHACARGFERFDIGQVAMLHALSYFEFRNKFYEAKDPLHPNYEWRDGRGNLEAWWNENIQRPSVLSHYNKDFQGDDSAEFCQANVKAVLDAQAVQSK
jgi:glutathione S-transferase